MTSGTFYLTHITEPFILLIEISFIKFLSSSYMIYWFVQKFYENLRYQSFENLVLCAFLHQLAYIKIFTRIVFFIIKIEESVICCTPLFGHLYTKFKLPRVINDGNNGYIMQPQNLKCSGIYFSNQDWLEHEDSSSWEDKKMRTTLKNLKHLIVHRTPNNCTPPHMIQFEVFDFHLGF